LPAAVKNFIWRVCHNILPTNIELTRMKVLNDGHCPICKRIQETLFHALWECPSVKAVWQESSHRIQKLSFSVDDGLALVQKLLEVLEEKDILVVFSTTRLLWLRRNSFVFTGSFTAPGIVVQQAQILVELFAEAQAHVQLPVIGPVEIEKWSRPPCNELKANWDAAWEGHTRMMGVGVVVRDWHGKVVAVVAETFYHSSDPTQAEARAAWRAISPYHDLGLHRVHFEGDSLNVVSALKKEEPCWTRFG